LTVSIEAIRSIQGDIQGIDGLAPRGPNNDQAGTAGGVSFADTLGQALESVDKLQLEADGQATKVANGGGNLHEMSLALEKADVGMRLAVKVRNKLLDAYNEIMKMGV
jgi:flagellar hook-basal body complex protein FliE